MTSTWSVAAWAAPRSDGQPKDERARQLYEDGLQASNDHNWQLALEKFETSYDIEENALTLFGLAQATRNAEGCRGAVPLYKQFMRMVPEGSEPYDFAREALVDCATEMAESEEAAEAAEENESPDPIPPPEEEDPAPVEDKPRKPKKDRPWHRDPLAAVLVSVGAATAVAGGVVMIVAQVQSGQTAPDYGAFSERTDRVKTMRIAGGVVLGIGGALLIGGVVRWAVLGARQNKSRTAVLPAFGPGGAGFTLLRRF